MNKDIEIITEALEEFSDEHEVSDIILLSDDGSIRRIQFEDEK